jgi:hypothetical protein
VAANTIIVMRVTRALSVCSGVAALSLALAACGSGTKTVSVAGAPASEQTQPPQPSTAKVPPPSHTTSTPQSGGAPTPTTKRSAPEPAFAERERGSEGVRAATALLRRKGFTPTNSADYHPHQALEVLIGMHSASGDGYGQQAFFFVNGRYIGTDASQPSATVRVVSQGDTEVTLSYPLYRKGDALCCPGGGQAKVRFQLNNGKLTALDPIPPLSSKTGLSRY